MFEHVAQKKVSEARRVAVQFSASSKPSRRRESEYSRKRRIHLASVLSTPSEIGSPACLILAALVGYIARKTREDIIRRTTAGRERARANGVKFGRKPKLSPAQRRQALARRAAGESQSAVARSFQVSESTISRLEQDRANYQ